MNRQADIKIIDLTPDTIAEYGVCGYKDVKKHLELKRKIDWVKDYYPLGLRIKALIADDGSYQGMIEYIPGIYAHRPVEAAEYIFIHCIFVGFKKEFKGRGFASLLIDECISDAKVQKTVGVATVTRAGSFMAKKDIFLKKGFKVVDTTAPDFELVALKFNLSAKDPTFKNPPLDPYKEGLTIIRSLQCPYSVKNVDAIIETAKKLQIDVNLVEILDHTTAQNTPSAFGTFCIIYRGEIISYHPISNTRFENIMKSKYKNRQ